MLECTLQLASDQHVELLVGASDLDIGFEGDRIVALDQRIQQLMQKSGLLVREALFKIVAFEQTCHADIRGQLD